MTDVVEEILLELNKNRELVCPNIDMELIENILNIEVKHQNDSRDIVKDEISKVIAKYFKSKFPDQEDSLDA